MMMRSVYHLIILFFLSGFATVSQPCTIFWFQSQNSNAYLAKNFDWHDGAFEVFWNEKGRNRREERIRSKNPFEWTVKYNSMTTNQRGIGMPLGGINEQGLAVEVLVYGSTKYELPDERPVLNEISWAQFVLDTAENVNEALQTLESIRIEKHEALLQYFLCDRESCAVVQFENHRVNVIQKERLEFAALTNWNYADSIRFTKIHEPFGGKRRLSESQGTHPQERFVRIANFMTFQHPESIADAFRGLAQVVQKNLTKWQVVYDMSQLSMTIRQEGKKDQSYRFKEFEKNIGVIHAK